MTTKVEIKEKFNNAFEQVLEYIAIAIAKWYLFMNGSFGKYGKLEGVARGRWQMATWTIFTILFFKYIMFPIFAWWEHMVDVINYVRWGC